MNIYSGDPTSSQAVALLNQLSDVLTSITGDSGRSSFDVTDMQGVRSVFALAKTGKTLWDVARYASSTKKLLN